jgi:WD40 repeat protein
MPTEGGIGMRILLLLILLVFPFLIAAEADLLSGQPPGKESGQGAADVDGNWRDLADPDAAKAYRAILALTKTPDASVAHIAARLQAAVAPDPAKVQRLIESLNGETFAVRDKASQELAKLGGLVETELQNALKAKPSLELSQRLEKLLNRLLGPIAAPDQLQAVRAVEVLEFIGTSDAKKLLAGYAAGAPGANLTRHAQTAVDHWGRIAPGQISANPPRTDLYGDTLPSGAVGRLGTIRFRRKSHSSFGHQTTAFLPGGQALATGDRDSLEVFEVPSGKPLYDIRGGTVDGRYALSPTGKEFAAAYYLPSAEGQRGPIEIQVREMPSGKIVGRFPRANAQSAAMVFSPDGKLLFSLDSPSAGRESTIRVEEISTGKELARRRFPEVDFSQNLALTPDGKIVAIDLGVNARKLFLWKWQSEEPRQVEASFPGRGLERICFSPDGKLLAGVQAFGSLFLFEVPSGKEIYQQECAVSDYIYLGDIAFAPNGKTLAVSIRLRQNTSRGKIQFLEPTTGRQHGLLDTRTHASNFVFSADSRYLAMGVGSCIRLWDFASLKEMTSDLNAHEGPPNQILASATGALATCGDDHTASLWDAATTKQLHNFEAGHWVRAIALSPDAKLLAASSLDDAVHVWDANAGKETYRLAGHGRNGGQRALTFVPGEQALLSWGDDFYLRKWNMKSGKAILEHAIRPKGVDFLDDDNAQARAKRDFIGFGGSAFTHDGKTLVLIIGQNLHLFETNAGKEVATIPSQHGIGDRLAVFPNSQTILLSKRGDYPAGKQSIVMLDLATGKNHFSLLLRGYLSGPVAISPDARTFAASVEEEPRELRIYEIASGQVRLTFRDVPSRVWSLAYLNDGRRVATGQADSSVLIWDHTSAQDSEKGSRP